MPDILSVALRALSFLLLLQAAGIALFVVIFGRQLTHSESAIRRLGVGSALLALVCVGGHYALEAARMAGEFTGLWDMSLQASVLRSKNGAAFVLRLLGLLLIAAGLRFGSAVHRRLALTGVAIGLMAFLVVGHTAAHPQRAILAPLLLVHLLIVAFWIGALLPLYLLTRREAPEVSVKVVNDFSATATWWVPGILLAGLAMTALLVPNLGVFQRPYGMLLLAKLAGFAVLMILASLNKWRLGPAIAQGAAKAFQRSVIAEYLLIFAVLAVTAVMTTFFSPE